jgi:hypothetical protein
MLRSNERKENRRKKAIVAVISVLLILPFLVESVGAYPKLPPGPVSKTELEGYCNEHGGNWFPACGGNHYCCDLPDGTFIDCNGSVCTVSNSTHVSNIGFGVEGVISLRSDQLINMKLNDLAAQVGALLEGQNVPDLVPLPTPGSTPPEGFCRRNDQGQLLVNVYNQGGTDAVASTTQVIFAPGGPGQFAALISIPTPALAAYTGTDLPPIPIPNSCFNPNTLQCSFTIGVDLNNTVLESNETNNNASGLCGPQIQ